MHYNFYIFYSFFYSCEVVKAVFEKQPPSNLRKSNFFHFVLSLYDKNNNPIETEKGLFNGFIKELDVDEGDPKKNGIQYRLKFTFANGKQNLWIFNSNFNFVADCFIVNFLKSSLIKIRY